VVCDGVVVLYKDVIHQSESKKKSSLFKVFSEADDRRFVNSTEMAMFGRMY
jgi:uncharacterized protein (DUF302 family)